MFPTFSLLKKLPNFFDRSSPCLRHAEDGEDCSDKADATVQPEGAAGVDALEQVGERFGHDEPHDEGETDDDGIGDGPNLGGEKFGSDDPDEGPVATVATEDDPNHCEDGNPASDGGLGLVFWM